MPYKDPNRQRTYQRNWIAKRRKNFFKDKVCENCGSNEKLELHHQDPNVKRSHRIWSWSKKRRVKEINKCIVLCSKCHLKISKRYLKRINKGRRPSNRSLTDEQAVKVKKMIIETDLSLIEISKKTGVKYHTVRDISYGKRYVNVHPILEPKYKRRTDTRKLNEPDVIEIKTRLRNGEKQKNIAKDFDVEVPAISKINTGMRWSNVNI